MALPTVGMELHTSCDSDVELSKQHRPRHASETPVTLIELITSNELMYRLIPSKKFKHRLGTNIYSCALGPVCCIWRGLPFVVPDDVDNEI